MTLLESEEITDCSNEAGKGANTVQRNLFSCFIYFLSVASSVDTSESSSDPMFLIT